MVLLTENNLHSSVLVLIHVVAALRPSARSSFYRCPELLGSTAGHWDAAVWWRETPAGLDLILDVYYGVREVWLEHGGCEAGAQTEWPVGINSGPLWLALLMERKRWNVSDAEGEDRDRFVTAMSLVAQWRKDGLFPFLDPQKRAQTRCSELEATATLDALRERDDITFEEIVLFAVLASSRNFHEWCSSSPRCHVLLYRWFHALSRLLLNIHCCWFDEQLARHVVSDVLVNGQLTDRERRKERQRAVKLLAHQSVFLPVPDVIDEPLKQTDTSKDVESLCYYMLDKSGVEKEGKASTPAANETSVVIGKHYRVPAQDKSFRDWLYRHMGLEDSSEPWSHLLDVYPRPAELIAKFADYGVLPHAATYLMEQPGFQDNRRVLLPKLTLEKLETLQRRDSSSLSCRGSGSSAEQEPLFTPQLYETKWSCNDFSRQYSRLRLMTLLGRDSHDLARNPYVLVLYECIARRHFALGLSLMNKMRRSAARTSWAEACHTLLLPVARHVGLVEPETDIHALYKQYHWARRHRLDRAWRDTTKNLGEYRHAKQCCNNATLMHLAASACRRTNKHRNLAGLADFAGYRPAASLPVDFIEVEVGRYDADGHVDAPEFCESSRLMEYLRVIEQVDVYQLDYEGMTPFFYSVVSGCLECCEYMMCHLPLTTRDILGRSLVYCASCVGEAQTLKWLLHNLDLRRYDLLTDKSILDRTPLCKATWGDYPEVVAILLDAGCNPCYVDNKLRTPLHTALWGPCGGRSGTKVVGCVDGMESISCARQLLEHPDGKKALYMYDVDGNAPIHIVSSTNAVAGLRLLLEFEPSIVNLPSQTELGWDALMCAAYRGHYEIVALLVANGAETNNRDADGRTCFEYAIRGGNDDILTHLLDHSEDLEAPFLTYLIHVAAFNAQAGCLVTLLRKHCALVKGSAADYGLRHEDIDLMRSEVFCASEHDLCSQSSFTTACVLRLELPDRYLLLRSENLASDTVELLTPLHSVLVGQKVIPLSVRYYRSSKFPPFVSYDQEASEYNAGCVYTGSLGKLDPRKRVMVYKHFKLDAGNPKLVVSAAMMTCISILQWYLDPLYCCVHFPNCWEEWYSALAVCARSTIMLAAKHTKCMASDFHAFTRSSPELLKKLGITQYFETLQLQRDTSLLALPKDGDLLPRPTSRAYKRNVTVDELRRIEDFLNRCASNIIAGKTEVGIDELDESTLPHDQVTSLAHYPLKGEDFLLGYVMCDAPLYSFEVSKVRTNLSVPLEHLDSFLAQSIRFMLTHIKDHKPGLSAVLRQIECFHTAVVATHKLLHTDGVQTWPRIFGALKLKLTPLSRGTPQLTYHELLEEPAPCVSEMIYPACIQSVPDHKLESTSTVGPIAPAPGEAPVSVDHCKDLGDAEPEPVVRTTTPTKSYRVGMPTLLVDYMGLNNHTAGLSIDFVTPDILKEFWELLDVFDQRFIAGVFLHAVETGQLELVALARKMMNERKDYKWDSVLKDGYHLAASKRFVDVAELLSDVEQCVVRLPQLCWTATAADPVSLVENQRKQWLNVMATGKFVAEDLLVTCVRDWEHREELDSLSRAENWTVAKLVDTVAEFDTVMEQMMRELMGGANRSPFVGVDVEFHHDCIASIQIS